MNKEQKHTQTIKPAIAVEPVVSGGISLEVATKRIRQAVEYGKYKAWNSATGEQIAQSIMDDFHNGIYGSKSGMWVQVNEAVEMMESLYCR